MASKLVTRAVGAGLALGFGMASIAETAEAAPRARARIVSESDTSADIRVQTGRYEEIGQLCLTFNFSEENPLDPGEEYTVAGLGGAVNIGSEPLTSRQTCAEQGLHDAFLEGFKDGKELVSFDMVSGTADVASVDVRVVGIQA